VVGGVGSETVGPAGAGLGQCRLNPKPIATPANHTTQGGGMLVVVGAVFVTGWLFVAYLLMNPEGM
jgi:hypothetical protein